MSENIITNYFEESKGVLKKELETMVEQTKGTLSDCKSKALSKI